MEPGWHWLSGLAGMAKIVITPRTLLKKDIEVSPGQFRTIRVVSVVPASNSIQKAEDTTFEIKSEQSTDAEPLRSLDETRIILKRPFDDECTGNELNNVFSSSVGNGRKRQRLDHLTQDQKCLRRKLKNRVAAQSARDRKKAQMDELSVRVGQLERESEELVRQNDTLREQNELLSAQNALLVQRLERFERAASDDASVESAALINAPQQQGQERRLALMLALGLLNWASVQVTLASALTLTLARYKQCQKPCSAPIHSASDCENNQPPVPAWWGPGQKAWRPPMEP